MRFLAYGGTSFTERRRLGAWPEIPSAILQDLHGVEGQRRSFGVGVLSGGPFLIVRELQNAGQRGGYAYTVLVEPREADWQRFRWNAAWMIASLLADTRATQYLLREPEPVSEPLLESVWEGLAPVPLSPATAPEPLAALFVRAALEREPLVSALPPGVARPAPETLAAQLDTLPVALRTGAGWLIGGAGTLGAALGCALVLDDRRSEAADAAPGIALGGAVARVARTHERVRALLDQPRWAWGGDGDAMAADLRVLASLAGQPARAWSMLEAADVRRGPLAPEIRAAVVALAREAEGGLSRGPTEVLLRAAEAGEATIDADEASRLDHDTLLAWFEARATPPAPWPKSILLPDTLRDELWQRAFHRLPVTSPDLVRRAVRELGGGERARGVAEAGIAGARTHGASLLDWRGRAHDPVLAAPLREWARADAAQRRGTWADGYLAFADDPGGVWLATTEASHEDARRVVLAATEALDTGDRAGAAAWLEALARSPLRDRVPLEVKLALPANVGGPWRALDTLRTLYDYNGPTPAPAAHDEQAFLARELESLMRQPPAEGPNIDGLRALLGSALSERTLTALRNLRRARERRARTSRGFRRVVDLFTRPLGQPRANGGKAERAGEGRRTRGEAPRARTRGGPAASPEMTETLRTHLLGGTASENRQHDRELTALLTRSTAAAATLDDARNGLAALPAGLFHRLAMRCAPNARLFDAVMGVAPAPLVTELLEDMVVSDPEGMAEHAAERVRRLQEGGDETPGDGVVLTALHYGVAKGLRPEVARHVRVPAAELEAWLDRLTAHSEPG